MLLSARTNCWAKNEDWWFAIEDCQGCVTYIVSLVGLMAEVETRFDGRGGQLETNMIELVGAQAETELRLSRLIAVLERRFGDDGQKPE